MEIGVHMRFYLIAPGLGKRLTSLTQHFARNARGECEGDGLFTCQGSVDEAVQGDSLRREKGDLLKRRGVCRAYCGGVSGRTLPNGLGPDAWLSFLFSTL